MKTTRLERRIVFAGTALVTLWYLVATVVNAEPLYSYKLLTWLVLGIVLGIWYEHAAQVRLTTLSRVQFVLFWLTYLVFGLVYGVVDKTEYSFSQY